MFLDFLASSWLGRITQQIGLHRVTAGLPRDEQQGVQNAVFPRIVVAGDESVAKTSVLRRIIMRNVLPSGPDIVTRRPILIQLRNQSESVPFKMILQLPSLTSPLETQSDLAVCTAIQQDFDSIRDSGVGIAEAEGTLTLYSHIYPNCDLVDLPGMMIVSQTDEPSSLPGLVKALIMKYMKVPKCIVLAIIDSNVKERQSPTVGLLKETKPSLLIKVLTKPDLAIRREEKDPMLNLTNQLNNVGVMVQADLIVSVKNNFNGNFEEIGQDEMAFFQNNLSDQAFQGLKPRLGMQALLSHISNLSENSTRHGWKQSESVRYAKELKQFKTELASLGAKFSSADIATILVEKVFKAKLLNIIYATFDAQHKQLPTDVLSDEAEFDFETFYFDVLQRLIEAVQKEFLESSHQLFRFQTFLDEFTTKITERWKECRADVLARWQELYHALMLHHDIDCNYAVESWQKAACCCLVQKFFFKLDKISMPNDTIYGVAQRFMQKFSDEENEAVRHKRIMLTKQIGTVKDILKML
jgi:hypothetical protein